MAATILVWYSHRGSLFDFGHVSLAISQSHALTSRESRVALVSWYNNNANPTSSDATRIKSGGSVNPAASFAGADPGMSLADSGQSSGRYAGWEEGENSYNAMPGRVVHEFKFYGKAGREQIQEVEKKLQELTKQNKTASLEYAQLARRLKKLHEFYPKLGHVYGNQKNEWMTKFFDDYKTQYSIEDYHRLLETRVRPAQVTITIPTLSDPDVYIGLNDIDMLYWWQHFLKNSNNKYHWRKRNCAAVVAACLLAGGASAMVAPPKEGLFWAPKNLQEWGGELAKMYEEFQYRFKHAVQEIKANRKVLPSNTDLSNIWSVTQWKRESDAGLFARRYGLLQQVDVSLDMYHQLARTSHSTLRGRNVELHNLSTVVIYLGRILIERSGTKRKKAFVQLGMQALTRIERLKAQQMAEDLAQGYAVIAQQLKDEHEIDHEQYKNLRSLIAAEFPANKVQNDDELAQIMNQLQQLSQHLDGYKPDIRGIEVPDRPNIIGDGYDSDEESFIDSELSENR